jgi:Tol biopolymer transport system component
MFDIYVYDRKTRNFLPLAGANTSMSELNAALSPDGRYVAYSTDSEGGGDIRLYDIGLQRLIPLPGLNDPYFADKNPSICDRR